MLYPVKPSFLIKSIWFSGGAAAAYAAYYATFKDLWGGAKMVSCSHLLLARQQHSCYRAKEESQGRLRVNRLRQLYSAVLPPSFQVAQAHGTLPPVIQEDSERKQQERLFGPAARAALGAQWNSFIDSTLGRLAQELAKRGI